MKVPVPTPKRVLYTTGTFASPRSEKNVIHKLVSTRPFTQQIDIVFPLLPNSDLQARLNQLTTTYRRRQWSLPDFIQYALAYRFETDAGEEVDRSVVAVGLPGPHDDDSWCFDGEILSISMGKDTWQRFSSGDGTRLPWKEHEETKSYRISLQQLAQLSSRLKHSFESWDQRRGLWEVVYHHEAKTNTDNSEGDKQEIRPITRITRTAHIPTPLLAFHPQDKEDWEEEVSALFEWVGMACLGSERLQANDHPDPYIAVYEPPETSKVGNLVHMCWKGFIPRSFLRRVLDTVSAADSSIPFISVTGHAILQSPVTYSRTTAKQQRVPSNESEDTWSLVLQRNDADGLQTTHWVMGESIGKWDSRLG